MSKRAKGPEGVSVFFSKSKKRFLLAYATPTGWTQKALPRDVATQRAADAWATTYLATLGAKPAEVIAVRRDEGPTIAACAEKWIKLREKDPKVAPSTLGNNKSQLKNYVLPTLGNMAIAALDVPQIREWVRGVRAVRAPQTTRNIFYCAATLYADAMVEGWVHREANPFSHPGAVRELPELDDAAPVEIAMATAQTLLDAPVIALERRARYAMAFTSGTRDGELAGLRLSDLNRDGAVPLFRVEQAVALSGLTGWATPNRTKTRGSKRTLPFHPAALAAVNEWLTSGWPALVGREPTPADYLFPGPSGGLVARARLVDVILPGGAVEGLDAHEQRVWYTGAIGLVLADVEPLPFVACKGALGLFDVDVDALGIKPGSGKAVST